MDTTTSFNLSADLIAHRLQSVENVIVIDMRDVATYTDFFLVGTVANRKALQESVAALRELAREASVQWRIEGADDWTLVDLDGYIVHLFTPKGRSKWRLDQLWGMVPQRQLAARAHARELIRA
jgi:ribosome-associated protein